MAVHLLPYEVVARASIGGVVVDQRRERERERRHYAVKASGFRCAVELINKCIVSKTLATEWMRRSLLATEWIRSHLT